MGVHCICINLEKYWEDILFLHQNISYKYSKLQIKAHIHILFFLFLLKNIYCVYSLEAPHWAASNEYNNIRFVEK